MKKRFMSMLLAMTMVLGTGSPSYATGFDSESNDLSVVAVYTPDEVLGAKVTFIDSTLINNDSGSSPLGIISEEYDHSYYVYDHRAISQHDVGPRENEVFIISVAAGATKTLERTKTVSGTIKFDASGTIPSALKKVINIGLGLSASGTYTYSWKVGETFSGPTEPGYNTISYYGAINYDLFSCYVQRYDVYKVYDGSSYVKDVEYYVGLTTINNVKVPKAIEYSVPGKV